MAEVTAQSINDTTRTANTETMLTPRFYRTDIEALNNIDLEPVRARLADLARPIDLRTVPYKEKVKLRLARQRPPVDPALLATAPEPDAIAAPAPRGTGRRILLQLPAFHAERPPQHRP